MKARLAGLAAVAAMLAGCGRAPERMELWYWHHSYLVSEEAVLASKRLIDRAAHAGYTGMALWDSSLVFLSFPDWPKRNVDYLREVIAYAKERGMRVMPLVAPYGHSGDVLKVNPNWAEPQRIEGARFRVMGAQLVQVKSLAGSVGASARPVLAMRLPVEPWRQYRVRFKVKTAGFRGLAQIEVSDGKDSRLDERLTPAPDQDWTPMEFVFPSKASTAVRVTIGAFGGHAGELLVGECSVEETAFAGLVRRAGAPMRVYAADDPEKSFQESRDWVLNGGALTLPDGSALRAGEEVAVDFYAVTPRANNDLGICLTDEDAQRWMTANARKAAELCGRGSGLLLGHDEMREMNSCASCRAKHMTAGELLAWSFARTAGTLAGEGPLYVWSDMFDPYHNARRRFAYVEGDLVGSWRSLARDVTVVNWNLEHLRASLGWFAGDDPRQPVPHRQIIAGYYDPADRDGARAARSELRAAMGIPGVVGMMYTTWLDDYSQLEAFAAAARAGWEEYCAARPW